MVVSICIGLCDLDSEKRQRLEERLTGDTLQFDVTDFAENSIPYIGYVELFGAKEDCCIAEAIRIALNRGTKVRIPKGFTFDSNGETNLRQNVQASFEVARLSRISPAFKYGANQYYHFFYPD